MLSAQVVSATLYRLADWLQPPNATSQARSIDTRKSAQIATFPSPRLPDPATRHLRGPRPALARKPLRVVRVLDAEASRTNTGRIVISGCISDVCAELDRLAQAEGAAA